jgi:hypothetical protein
MARHVPELNALLSHLLLSLRSCCRKSDGRKPCARKGSLTVRRAVSQMTARNNALVNLLRDIFNGIVESRGRAADAADDGAPEDFMRAIDRDIEIILSRSQKRIIRAIEKLGLSIVIARLMRHRLSRPKLTGSARRRRPMAPGSMRWRLSWIGCPFKIRSVSFERIAVLLRGRYHRSSDRIGRVHLTAGSWMSGERA